MSRFGPISPISPDVPQMVDAGGRQANVRNQQSLQRAQIAQRGQIASNQQALQQQQMQQQAQIAQGNRALEMSKVHEQARSQAEYRDFLREKSEVDQQLQAGKMAQDAAQYDEEMNYKQQVADRSYNLELAGYKAKLAGLEAAAGGEAAFEEQMERLYAEQNDIEIRRFQAETSRTNQGIDLNRQLEMTGAELDKTLTAHATTIDDVNVGLAASLSDANFTVNLIDSSTGFSDMLGDVYQRTIRGQVLPNVTEGMDFSRSVMRTLEHIGEPTARSEAFAAAPPAVESAQALLERSVADKVASALPIDETKKGALRDILSAAFKRASQVGTDGAQMIKLRKGLNEQFQKAGIENTMIVDEALNTAAKILRQNVQAYSSGGFGDDINAIDNFEEKIEVTFRTPDGAVTSDSVRADQAFLNSRLYRAENVRGINALAAGGSSLDRLRKFREMLSPDKGLTSEALIREINTDPFGKRFDLREGSLMAALLESEDLEDAVEAVVREGQEFGLREKETISQANLNLGRSRRQAEAQALRKLLGDLE